MLDKQFVRDRNRSLLLDSKQKVRAAKVTVAAAGVLCAQAQDIQRTSHSLEADARQLRADALEIRARALSTPFPPVLYVWDGEQIRESHGIVVRLKFRQVSNPHLLRLLSFRDGSNPL